MVELDEVAVKKIQFSRHLYFLSEENLSSENHDMGPNAQIACIVLHKSILHFRLFAKYAAAFLKLRAPRLVWPPSVDSADLRSRFRCSVVDSNLF